MTLTTKPREFKNCDHDNDCDSNSDKTYNENPGLPVYMLVAIILSILILLILVATAHIWCRLIRRGRCCDKTLDSDGESRRENDQRHPANIERGVASVTGFVLEATAPTSTRVLELSTHSSGKPLTLTQIERLPRKIFTDFLQTDNGQSNLNPGTISYNIFQVMRV